MKILLGLLVAVAAQPATVPMLLEGNVPIVELELPTASGGTRTARFVIDTGGGSVVIGSKLMVDIGAKTQGEPMAEEGSKMQALASIRILAAGEELDSSGIPVFASLENERVISRDNAEGMLPGRLLSRYHLILDYPGRTLIFAKPGSVQPRGTKLKAAIGDKNGFPRIEATVGDQTYGFLLDSGASFTMISRVVLENWSKANPDWNKTIGAAGLANMMGGKMENEALMLRIADLKLGPFTVRNAAAVSRPEGTFEKWMSRMMPAPIIGSIAGNILRDFRVEIDYQSGAVYLERAKNPSSPEISGVGLILSRAKAGLVVTGVSSTAVKSAVQSGDILVAVDGEPMSGKSLSEAARALSGAKGSKKQLALLRNGESIRVDVVCVLLL